MTTNEFGQGKTHTFWNDVKLWAYIRQHHAAGKPVIVINTRPDGTEVLLSDRAVVEGLAAAGQETAGAFKIRVPVVDEEDIRQVILKLGQN